MPIIDKRDRNNWYNRIPTTNPSPWEHFSADKLKGSEIRCGDAMIAKIPDIPGRIGRRNVSSDGYTTHYVEFILERHYDPEKRQSRNKRVIIGTDISHIYRGMMIINDNYYQFFDHKGQLIWQPEPKQEEPEPKPEQIPEQPAELKPQPIPDQAGYQTDEQTEAKTAKVTDTPGRRTAQDSKPEEETEEKDAYMRGNEYMDEEPDDQKLQEDLDRAQREKDHLEFLHNVLLQYRNVIDDQARKKPEKRLTPYQIRRINELLKELKDYFRETEADSYLHLAEEPDDNNPDTCMTYGDMAIILSTYSCAITTCNMGRLWYKHKND